MRRLTATIGHPEMHAFHEAVSAATTVAELEAVVHGAIGVSELMEFARFDSGDVLRKERAGQGPRMLRLVVGNPLIMKEMAKVVPDAASRTCSRRPRGDRVHELGLAAAARAIRNWGVSSETYVGTLLERARAHADLNAIQQLTGKRAQTPRDFLFGHKAALIAAA